MRTLNGEYALVGQIYLGREAFYERMQKLAASGSKSREIPRSQRIFVRPTFDVAIELVCRIFGETPQSLRLKSRRPGRKALALIATLDCGLPPAPISEWLSCSDSAVSKLIRAAQQLHKNDRAFRKRIKSDAPRSGVGIGLPSGVKLILRT